MLGGRIVVELVVVTIGNVVVVACMVMVVNVVVVVLPATGVVVVVVVVVVLPVTVTVVVVVEVVVVVGGAGGETVVGGPVTGRLEAGSATVVVTAVADSALPLLSESVDAVVDDTVTLVVVDEGRTVTRSGEDEGDRPAVNGLEGGIAADDCRFPVSGWFLVSELVAATMPTATMRATNRAVPTAQTRSGRPRHHGRVK